MAVITDKTPLKSWIPIINSNTTTSKEASTTASSALSTANTAVSKADAAQSSADSAMAAATAAQNRADTAATAAERKASETVFGNVQVTNDYTSGGLAENSIASSPTAVNRLFDDVLAAANQAANSVGGSISNDVAANLSASISALNLRADDIEDSIEVLENPVATGSTTARTLQDRFADIINVKDFGAVGDGQTDDTAAFEAAAEASGDRHIYVPSGDYVVTAKVDGVYYSHEEPSVPAEFVTMANRAFAGNVKAIYISSTGNDKNDGKSTSTPIKTLARAFQMMNFGTHTQYSFYLMGDAVYDVPNDVFVIGQSCPHFYSVNGSPTMRFTYTGGAGPRFYGGHVNMTGNSETNRLKIDAAYGSMYFEGTAISVTYVDFLVPIKVVGGSFAALDIGVTNDKSSPAVSFTYTNAKVSGTTFYNNIVNCKCFSAVHGSIFMGYGDLTFINVPEVEAIGPIINLEHTYSKLSISGDFLSNELLPNNVNVLSMYYAVAMLSTDLYSSYNANGINQNGSTILIGNNVINSQSLRKGSTIDIGSYYINGCVTGGLKRLAFTYPLTSALAPDVETVTISFSAINVRDASGFIGQSLTIDSLASSEDANGVISTDRMSVSFYMDFEEAFQGTNNSCVNIQFAQLKLILG